LDLFSYIHTKRRLILAIKLIISFIKFEDNQEPFCFSSDIRHYTRGYTITTVRLSSIEFAGFLVYLSLALHSVHLPVAVGLRKPPQLQSIRGASISFGNDAGIPMSRFLRHRSDDGIVFSFISLFD
jgi:hypothetical protein